MAAQTVGRMMHKKKMMMALVVMAAASVLLSLTMLIAPSPAQASTTFTVNLLSDNEDASDGDNLCDINTVLLGDQCTLRAAIQQANRTPGEDTINFNIPDTFGKGVKTIHVGDITGKELPPITEVVAIDGYTQPGSSQNTLAKGTNAKLMIQLEGSALGGNGVGLSINPSSVLIRGLVINRFYRGIEVGSNASDISIEGNFIGTYPSGTKAPVNSQNGVVAFGGATVGGPEPAARNLISGNGADGIDFYNGVVSAYGNLIGTQSDGESPLGNQHYGVYLYSQDRNHIGKAKPGYANTIAFNKEDGVLVINSVGNSVLSNSIHSNGGLGIDLIGPGETVDTNVMTPNDPGDIDTGGANNLQNHPTLSSASKPTPTKTVVKGKLNSTPTTSFKVQFFSNPSATDEGNKLLGTKTVKTDDSGNVSFPFATTRKVGLGQNITATATNTATGDTSEFSAPRKVVAS